MSRDLLENQGQLTLHEVTLYPLSGSFGKHYGSLMELSAANEDFLEIENAYFRYTCGDEDAWFTARLGIFHPFEGYGASDRPFSLSRPFFQRSTSNNGAGSTFFRLWGFGEADFHPTEITAVGGRFDWYDPSTDIENNQKWGATAFANVPLNDGLQLIAEFQHVQQKQGDSDDIKDDSFQIRMIWIQ